VSRIPLDPFGRPSNQGGASRSKREKLDVPGPQDWDTTDEQELNRRKQRALDESFEIRNLEPRHPIFSNFEVQSESGQIYCVEVQDPSYRQWVCNCVDFRINGLGTCKHAEAVANHLAARYRRLWATSAQGDSPRIDIMPDRGVGSLRVVTGLDRLPAAVQKQFTGDGVWVGGTPEEGLQTLELLARTRLPEIRISHEVRLWLEQRQRAAERVELRREYELKVQAGEWPEHETLFPLFPYQREGMLHLAFKERALLADEMGLGKTIQAIAACALLHRLGKARRVLVVTPASLKTEWEEQIQRFTTLPAQLVFGGGPARRKLYELTGRGPNPPVFTVVNYEQMIRDAAEVNEHLRPDIVILDEAQRIKNWTTITTQAIKLLRSRYAFVLTGTPIENRIDELYSLMDFLDPSTLGSLFRFNRDFYTLDERGRPAGYKNLQQLHDRVAPFLLRRRKSDVETQLPARTDRNHFVPLSPQQKQAYEELETKVARLAAIAARRPLTRDEMEKLLSNLAKMRMTCDTNHILNPKERECPKLIELRNILEEIRSNPGVKVIIFSEWERMLQLVRGLCEELKMGFAWHTGSVPQQRRRGEINAFKNDPDVRVFLSTDSGSTGLNLQVASVVVNCDLPWNPARLEQRIARAWRKHQTRAVSVINLASENTIEHRMLETLAHKQALADGVLDLRGDLNEIKMKSSREGFLSRLKLMVPTVAAATPDPGPPQPVLPADRAKGFAEAAAARLRDSLVFCEERFLSGLPRTVLYTVVRSEAALWRVPLAELQVTYFADRDPMASVHLEVVDQTTHEAIERLVAAGLIQRATRATRSLWPPNEAAAGPLNATELQQAGEFRAQASRRLKLAHLLGASGFEDEAQRALSDAVESLGKALAIEQRLPPAATASDVLQPPLSCYLGESLPALRAWIENPSADWKAAVDKLREELNAHLPAAS